MNKLHKMIPNLNELHKIMLCIGVKDVVQTQKNGKEVQSNQQILFRISFNIA